VRLAPPIEIDPATGDALAPTQRAETDTDLP
jgi:hypothetical protein